MGPILQGLPSAGLTWTHLGTIVVPYWVQLGSLESLLALEWTHVGPTPWFNGGTIFWPTQGPHWVLRGSILDPEGPF